MRTTAVSAEIGRRTLQVLPAPSDLSRDVSCFLLDRQARGLAPRSVEFYADRLRHLARCLEAQGIRSVEAVTADHLRAWLTSEATHRTPGGVRAQWRAAAAFLRWWEDEHEPEHWRNPVRKVKPPRATLEPLPPVPLDSVRAMVRTCAGKSFEDLRDAAILLALLDTGARAAEFLSLRVADVDLQTGAVTIRRGKGGKNRTAFLGKRARLRLARYLRKRRPTSPAEPLWTSRRTGEGLTQAGLWHMLGRRAEAARVPVPGPHSFRRAFAIGALRAGADAVSVSRLLGHSDLATVSRYLKQEREDLQAVHERTAPGDRL